MKKLLLVGAALALCLGYASAQNITKSLQGSQDPRGPVGLDTSNSSYFPGHINAFGQTTGPLSVASCGSLTNAQSIITLGSTDVAGTVLPLQAAGCNVIFGSLYNSPPICMVQQTSLAAAQTTAQSLTWTTTTSGINLANTSSGAATSWICIGNK